MAAQSPSDVVDISGVDSTPLDIDDLFDVQSELNPIIANWRNVALALRMKPDVLDTIQAENPGNPTACLSVTLEKWLNRNYNVKKFGEPTWQRLVEAVSHPAGGANVALAARIAENHKAIESQMSDLMVAQRTSPSPQKETETESNLPLARPSTVGYSSSPIGIEQDEEVAEVTHQNKQNISAKYATLLANVYSRLQQKGIDVREFLLFVVARFPPGDCIPHSSDLAEVFEAITRNRLWDFLNYQPLEDIVKHFGGDDQKLNEWVKEYKAHLAGFKACMTIVNYLSEVESDSSFDESDSEQPTLPKAARYDRRYYRKLSLKLKVKVTDQSLSYIDDIWTSVSEYLLLPPLSVLLDHICKGSLTLVWLIPTGLVPQSLKRIRQGSDFFQQNSIESVTLDDQCVYNEASSVEQRQIIVDPHELLQACKQGDLEVVLQSLAADVDVDIKDASGGTLLIEASYYGKLDLISPLLLCGANVNAQDKEGWTPLLAASHYGDVRIVQFLLANQADVNVQNEDGFSPLHIASQEGHVDVCTLLIEQGANLNSPTKDGTTALYIASQNNHVTVVEQLLQSGASVDMQEETGATPLYISCQEGHIQVVEVLIAANADVNRPREDGASSLAVASQNGHREIVQMLIDCGANVNSQQQNGQTVLHGASWNGHHEIVTQLLKSGADVNPQTLKHQQTALSFASYRGHCQVVSTLLAAGANTDIQDTMGRSALTFASQHGHSDIVALLADSGAQLNLKTHEGRTALALASWEGHINVVKVLVAKGADANTQDEEGLTALILAIKQGHTEIVQELVNHGNADVNIQEKSTKWNALFFAAKDGNWDLTKLLIQNGANVWLKDKNGVTALDVANVFGHKNVCEEIRARMGSGRKHEQEQTTTELKDQVMSAGKYLLALFREVEKRILKTRTLKREMAAEDSIHDEKVFTILD